MNTIKPIKEPDKIINYWKKEKLLVACIIFFGISFNTAIVLGPIYQGKLLDSLVNDSALSNVISLAFAFVAVIGIIQLLRYFKRFYIRRFANKTSATMRMMIYNSIMHKNLSELKDDKVGNILTRAISDVDLCVEGMRKFTTEIFDTGVLMISYIIVMLGYDVKITILSIIFIPVAMYLAERLKTVIYKYSNEYRKKVSEVTNITYDSIENYLLYRINSMEKQNREKYNNHLSDLQSKAIKANLLENTMQPIYYVIAMIGIIIVIYQGGTKVINGIWTVGSFYAYITMFSKLAVKASKAAKLFNSVQKSQVSWKRIKPYLKDYEVKDKTIKTEVDKVILKVENLSVAYDGNNIINNISFEGKEGEIIGITGPIASGKSTLATALLGLYTYRGNIKVNNKELTEYTDYEKSKLISYQGHSPQLISDSIYNNIDLGCKNNIANVLRDVCLDVDLKSMENGQDTLVGNGGVKLSGGQQARVALARALVNKNKIIILDDPFSAVDTATENKIIENLRKNYNHSLIIIVSHRLAIFDKIDKVLLLNKDRSYQIGTHNDLIRECEVYKYIYNLQYGKGKSHE